MLTDAIRIDRDAIYPLHLAVTLTGVSRESVRAAIRDGSLAAAKRGKHWFLRGAELEEWLTESATPNLAQPARSASAALAITTEHEGYQA